MGFCIRRPAWRAINRPGMRRKKGSHTGSRSAIRRFHPVGNFIQAGCDGCTGKLPADHRLSLNLPLLYWASEETGDPKYRDIAEKHIHTTVATIREDHSTWHTFFFDMKTGHWITEPPVRIPRRFGVGERPGMGHLRMALAYKYTEREEYIQKFRDVTDFFLAHLPKDMVPFWDLSSRTGTISREIPPRRRSQHAECLDGKISKAGRGRSLPCNGKTVDEGVVRRIRGERSKRVERVGVTAPIPTTSPYNTCNHYGVDECNIWGDYFYMEALMRLKKDLNPYWQQGKKGRYGRMKREAFFDRDASHYYCEDGKAVGAYRRSNFRRCRADACGGGRCVPEIFSVQPSGIWSRPTSRYSLTERSTGRICRQTIRNLSGSSTDTAFS